MKSSTKKLTQVISVLAIVIFVTCSGSKNDSTEKNSQTETKKETVKAPGMDIHTAAFMGNLTAIKQHIEAGTDLNQKDQYGSTPLIIATTFDRSEVAIALINAGADLSITGNDGSTPLHTAAFLCRTEIVKALLDKGADKEKKNNYGSTALESVITPFSQVKAIYEQLNKDLGPLGLKLDLERIEKTRPEIAEILK